MSERTQQVLDFIRAYLVKNGYGPTTREIGRALGIRSTSVVRYHTGLLIRGGHLVRGEACASRVLVPVDMVIHFVGEEIPVEVDGELVRGRVVEPVAKAA